MRRCATSSAACPRTTCAACSAPTPVDLWGFDGDLLQSVADRVGPTVADLASPLALADIEDTFSWSLARPVPLMAGGA